MMTVILLADGEQIHLDIDPAEAIASRIAAGRSGTGYWPVAGRLLPLADVASVAPAHWLAKAVIA